MEIEMKFKCNHSNDIIEKIRRVDFKLNKEKHQIDTYFLVSKRSKDGTWDYLRIREENKKYSFDYHRVLNEMEAEEREIKVNDKDKLIEIMGFLGYKIKCVIDKKRKEYKKENISIVFDEVKSLGKFIEIEFIGESNERNKRKVLNLAEFLELNKKHRIECDGYPDLFLKNEKNS